MQDGWELEPLPITEGASVEPTVDLPAGISSGMLSDEHHGLSVDVPSGWKAWPGSPESRTRLHMEHVLSGATLKVHLVEEEDTWPSRDNCQWNSQVEGISSGLKHRGQVDSAVCWPEVPGDSRHLGWHLSLEEQHWLIEVKVPGGRAGLVDEALDALLPSLSFE